MKSNKLKIVKNVVDPYLTAYDITREGMVPIVFIRTATKKKLGVVARLKGFVGIVQGIEGAVGVEKAGSYDWHIFESAPLAEKWPEIKEEETLNDLKAEVSMLSGTPTASLPIEAISIKEEGIKKVGNTSVRLSSTGSIFYKQDEEDTGQR